MIIKIACNCGQPLEVNSDDGGKSFNCPACEQIVTVPLLPQPPIIKVNKLPKGKYICKECGFIGPRQTLTKGNIGMEIVLWLLCLLPGIIYSLWRLFTQHKGCRTCGGDMIPLNTPKGNELVNLYYKQ